VNGLNLREGLFGKLAGLQQEQFRVANHGSERVVDAVFHVGHITAERGVVFVARSFALCLTSEAQSFGSAQGLSRDEQEGLRPILAQGHVQQTRILAAEVVQFARVRGRAQDQSGTWFEGAQDFGEFAVAERADYDKIVWRGVVIFPKITAQDGDCGRMPLRLPARGQQPREIRFVA
jgi:hypothetical protein